MHCSQVRNAPIVTPEASFSAGSQGGDIDAHSGNDGDECLYQCECLAALYHNWLVRPRTALPLCGPLGQGVSSLRPLPKTRATIESGLCSQLDSSRLPAHQMTCNIPLSRFHAKAVRLSYPMRSIMRQVSSVHSPLLGHTPNNKS